MGKLIENHQYDKGHGTRIMDMSDAIYNAC